VVRMGTYIRGRSRSSEWTSISSVRASRHRLRSTTSTQSQFPPVGLFWTIELPKDSVEVQFGKRRASLQASDVPILDYGTIINALFGGGPSPVPGSVSFKVVWSGPGQRLHIRNTDSTYGGFAGEFIRNTAQIEWTATVGDYTFVSDPLATSSSAFAEIGRERNGSFFEESERANRRE
jgi:hypothetical protein